MDLFPRRIVDGSLYEILLGFFVVLISNCGSDGVLETASNNIFEQPRISTSVLNDGSIVRTEAVGLQKNGIVSLECYYRGEEANIILVSQNAEQAKEIMTTTSNWTTTASSSDDQQSVIGTDITYYTELDNSKSLTLLAEFYSANYGEEGETRECD